MRNSMVVLNNLEALVRGNYSVLVGCTPIAGSSWCLLRGESGGLNLGRFLHFFEVERRVKAYLFNRWNMYLNKLCENIISLSISIFFKDNDMIRFMGEYVHAKKTLKEVWFNDVKKLDSSFDKLWFSVTRVKEASYFKFKKKPVSDANRPSKCWIIRRCV